jgi:NTP pyrophosphatase (non-canonical NTP hydrolase)
MTFEEFQKFINEQDAFFRSLNLDRDDTRETFARTIKLGEEYGELCDEILASAGDQRKDKLDKPHELEGEFADVVIVAFLLAKAMNVDMQEALQEKIVKIRTKHNKQLLDRH